MAGGLVYTAVGSEAMATAEYYGRQCAISEKSIPKLSL